jgi:endonuclease YncB( thermonuclease family)
VRPPSGRGKKVLLWTGGIIVALIVVGGTAQQRPAASTTVGTVEAATSSTSVGAGTSPTVSPSSATSLEQSAQAKAAAEAKRKAAAAALQAAKEKAAKEKAAAQARAKAANATWAVTSVVDGDTIWVSRDGVSRKVRLIGIDTPEVGDGCYTEATRSLRGIIGGQPVTLTAGARDDIDRYGRLLRYVDVGGVDAGLRQIKRGYAVARYDSRDGYGHHTREAAYIRADGASPAASCARDVSGGSGDGPGTTPSPATQWPLAGDKYPCPQARPVKGNESSMIAHEPGDRYYLVTSPEQCFATMSDAIAAGFRPAKV